ncbi:Lipase GDSL domain-containing protein [Citrus sinensis]|uniref:Lipase GDSL domain-containing protein n=1 Tax=Citrus sinensis TaxID=2711 RepID=A0ACB8KUA9_CITSI|nr:Lipase GDSL domain-containing protein [Citrus sinensis]
MEIKLLLLCLFPLASFFLQCNCHCAASKKKGTAACGIRGMFVFGSSLVDNGNNNFLQNKAKVNYLPYGIDFPYGPSGRYTNGKNVIDLLGEQLQLPGLIPPFADPSTKASKIVHGVNFASGGSGILDDTGSFLGHVYSLTEQINKFEEVTLPELEAELGCNSTHLLSKYLFVVGVGGNDYTFNYFRPSLNGSTILDQGFASNLTNSLSQHLKKLYSLGGRKFVLMSLYPIGCIPMVKSFKPKQKFCLRELNLGVRQFNTQLKSMADAIKEQMPGSNIVIVNQYKIIMDIIKDPSSKGFKDAKRACCDLIPLSEGGNGVSCRKGGNVCGDRNAYVYFDGLHPTEAVNVHITNKAFSSYLKNEVYPINVSQLAKL